MIASIAMTAVGDAAMDMIEEIRRQFREIYLMEGTAEPDTPNRRYRIAAAFSEAFTWSDRMAVPPGWFCWAEALGGTLGVD